MNQYNQQIKALVEEVAKQILAGPLTQKKLNQIMAKLAKELKAPTDAFLKRVEAMALLEAISAEKAMVDTLVALAITDNIISITAKELEIISKHALTKNLIFTRWKNKARNSFVSDVYNLEDAIKALPTTISRNYRQRVLAGMIAGHTPAEVARSLVDRNLSKKIRRNIKTLYQTTAYKARSLANLEALKRNEAYFDYYEFKTMDDDRVETVCQNLQKESMKQKWITMDDIPVEAYTPVHFNCRCDIIPAFKK